MSRFNQMMSFIAVVEAGGFTQAAKRLHITATASKQTNTRARGWGKASTFRKTYTLSKVN